MSKTEYFRWFMTVYHAILTLCSLGVLWVLVRGGRVMGLLSRCNHFLCSFLAIQSVNVVWLVHYSDRLFGIKDQGIEIGRLYVWYILPLFPVSLLFSCLIREGRRWCLLLCLCCPLSIAAAYLWEAMSWKMHVR